MRRPQSRAGSTSRPTPTAAARRRRRRSRSVAAEEAAGREQLRFGRELADVLGPPLGFHEPPADDAVAIDAEVADELGAMRLLGVTVGVQQFETVALIDAVI